MVVDCRRDEDDVGAGWLPLDGRRALVAVGSRGRILVGHTADGFGDGSLEVA